MVEVFKTNVTERNLAMELIEELQHHFPDGIISFDFEDCDKVLRVQSEFCDPEKIMKTLIARGFIIETLPD